MTISSQEERTSAVGAGAVLSIPYTFPTSASGDLIVKQRVTATGAETTLTETTDYTATYGDSGGTVQTVATIASTDEVHVIRSTPITQLLDLTQGGSFSAENIESALDKITKILIELDAQKTRSLRAPDTDDASDDWVLSDSVSRKDGYLHFNETTGQPEVVTVLNTGTAVFGAFGTTFVAVATADAGLDALGFTAFTKTLVDDADAGQVLDTLGFTTFSKDFITKTSASAALTDLGVSSYMQTLLDDTNASTARTTLEISTTDDIVVHGGEVIGNNGDMLRHISRTSGGVETVYIY